MKKKQVPIDSAKYILSQMEKDAKKNAAMINSAFNGANAPGLKSIWLGEYIRALQAAYNQYNVLYAMANGTLGP